jgi:hypothetical protein
MFLELRLGTDVMIFKLFLPKVLAKNWHFLLKTNLNYAKNLITTVIFDKKPIFSKKIAKNEGWLYKQLRIRNCESLTSFP